MGILGCNNKRDPNAPPIIYNDAEYNQQLKKVEELSSPIVTKFYEGEPITDGDKDTMRRAKTIWQALANYNTRYTVYFGAGQAAFISEEYSEAILFLNSAIAYSPQNPDENEQRIIAEAYDLVSRASFFIGRFDQAEVAADGALKRAPNIPSYMHSKAQALGQMGRTKEAIALLNKALEIDPNHSRCKTLLRFLSTPVKPVERP